MNTIITSDSDKAVLICGKEADMCVEKNAIVVLRSKFVLGQKYLRKTHYRSWLWIMGEGKMEVNSSFVLFEGASIHIHHGGHLILDGGYFNENVNLVCESLITIGEGATIAPGVVIRDCDSHEIIGFPSSKPITIGKHVWIGSNAIILKGVTIGDGAVIGAGSVVTNDIPNNCVAVGNPAKVIKSDINWK